MRIVETKERTVSLDGAVTNAVVSFADHTVSLVALVSDEVRSGRPVVGFGFNSIGLYAPRGILCERMFPRVPS
ncbi:MAG: mandelate racemase, partial [Pseudomonadales bacterium]